MGGLFLWGEKREQGRMSMKEGEEEGEEEEEDWGGSIAKYCYHHHDNVGRK